MSQIEASALPADSLARGRRGRRGCADRSQWSSRQRIHRRTLRLQHRLHRCVYGQQHRCRERGEHRTVKH
jgi:hypothetical protein